MILRFPQCIGHPEGVERVRYQGRVQVCHESISAVSELLGISPEEIREERESGKSLVEIAREQGISEDAKML